MAMTEEQWAKFQSNFPQEDRIPYADYSKTTGQTADDVTAQDALNTETEAATAAQDAATQLDALTSENDAADAADAAAKTLAHEKLLNASLAAKAKLDALKAKNAADKKIRDDARDKAKIAAATAAKNRADTRAANAAATAKAAADKIDAKLKADADKIAAALKAAQDAADAADAKTKQAAADKAAADKVIKDAKDAADKAAAEAKATIKAAGPGTGHEDWTWDEAKGAYVAPAGTEPSVIPPGTPKGYILDKATGKYVQPPQEVPGSTWDDVKGEWILPSGDTTLLPPAGTPKGYVYDPTTKVWGKPKQLNPTDTWDDVNGIWVPKAGGGNKGLQQVGDLWYQDGVLVDGTVNGITYVNGKITTPNADDSAAIAAAIAAAKAADKAAADKAAAASAGGKGTFTQAEMDAAIQKALDASSQTTAKQNMIQVLTDRFAQYGLASLVPKIQELAVGGATEATITLALQGTEEYQKRFAANADRIKKGLSVLTPAEYLNIEDSYRQTLRAYGLKQFDTDAYVKQFIANDISPTELSNRVVTAVQRVQNADPAIQQQLKDYYGISAADMVGYVLDPEQSFQMIQRQIAASEIGVAGGRQGLTVGLSVADQLAAQGVTQAEAQKGYSTIADILPTAQTLSGIYGNTVGTYGQSEAEQETFNSLASAQRKRQQLSAAEIAQFSGSSGVSKGAFSTGYLSKQSSGGQF